jgi:hexosaminidase
VTPWGALRGLESFLQLVVWPGPDAAPGTYAVTRAPVTGRDAPRFTVRGVLIDTSFNFLTVAAIKASKVSL